jgi:hypothetical protein
VDPTAASPEGATLRAAVQSQYLPNRALVVTREGETLDALSRAVAFVGEKHAIEGRPTAYVCERGRCLAPTSDPTVLERQLATVAALPEEEKGD